jgi:hypothetical protein
MVDFNKLLKKNRIYKLLNNAKQNQYNEFLSGSALDIAKDLVRNCSEVENENPENLVELIESWQKENLSESK